MIKPKLGLDFGVGIFKLLIVSWLHVIGKIENAILKILWLISGWIVAKKCLKILSKLEINDSKGNQKIQKNFEVL